MPNTLLLHLVSELMPQVSSMTKLEAGWADRLGGKYDFLERIVIREL